MKWLFSFAARSLQPYIMRGGKLRDMVGATSLIDRLSAPAQLQEWLRDFCGVESGYEVVQAAAGAGRMRFERREDAERVARLWPLLCHGHAPGLEVVQDLREQTQSYAHAVAASGRALEEARNFPAARLPEAGPFAKRAPRTGEAAVAVDHAAAEREPIDLPTQRKRAERERQRESLPLFASAFQFTRSDQIPSDFNQISGDDRAYLAIVHADGNKLGEMFLQVGRALREADLDDASAVALFRYLSEEVVAAGTRAAVTRAMDGLAEGWSAGVPWPIAPIVLAGDDVTVVCRADLALDFTAGLLRAFRQETKARLARMREEPFWTKAAPLLTGLVPAELSAGAGIVFCTSHYPFSLAYELCESVARQAKDAAKASVVGRSGAVPPSALSFVRIAGGSAPADFEGLAATTLRGSDQALLTGCPYFLDGPERPYEPLRAAAAAAKRMPSSTLRALLGLQRTDAARVPEAVGRMMEVAGGGTRGERSGPAGASAEAKPDQVFERCWRELCGKVGVPGWQDLRFQDRHASPLLDVLNVLFAERQGGKLEAEPAREPVEAGSR